MATLRTFYIKARLVEVVVFAPFVPAVIVLKLLVSKVILMGLRVMVSSILPDAGWTELISGAVWEDS